MTRKTGIIGFVLLAFIVYAVYRLNEARPTDWTQHFAPDSESPYGTRILTDALPILFPKADIVFPREGMLNYTRTRDKDSMEIYFMIGNEFRMSEEQWMDVWKYVMEGNILFMSANVFPKVLLERLRVGMDVLKGSRDFINQRQEQGRRYVFGRDHWVFVPQAGYSGETLGYSGTKDTPNYIRVAYGRGWIYLHANPLAFTNYYLLDSVDGDYYAKALAFLPLEADVAWDNSSVNVNGEWIGSFSAVFNRQSLFRVLMAYPALRWAFILLLLAGCLYLIFRSKREQRAIPVVRPPENKTLEFVSVVASLYYKQGEHGMIARKRIDYFLQEVRYVYRLEAKELDDEFIRLLSERSGVKEERVTETVNLIRSIRNGGTVSGRQLQRLMKCMEYFKHK